MYKLSLSVRKRSAGLGGRAVCAAVLACSSAVAAVDVSGVLSSKNYVQEGLVAHFDAVENVGVGQHDASAARWRDLKGSAFIERQKNAGWLEQGFDSSMDDQYISNLPALHPSAISVEVAMNILSNGSHSASAAYPHIFREGNSRYAIHFEGSTSDKPVFAANGLDGRLYPKVPFRKGTIAALSDATNYRLYIGGSCVKTSGEKAVPSTTNHLGTGAWNLNGQNGWLHGHYFNLRFYNRALTDTELAHNTVVDQLRFFSFRYDGTGGTSDWKTVSWKVPPRQTETAPATNDYVQIRNATLRVASSDGVAWSGLSLEQNARLDLAADTAVPVKVLFVGGSQVERGIYTGTGTYGTQVDWLSGPGTLHVAGGVSRGIPKQIAEPAADGWFEFGRREGFASGNAKWQGTERVYIVADHPCWDDYSFPQNAKLRLVGGILLDDVPSGVFSEIDASHLKLCFLNGMNAFGTETPLRLPETASVRYLPGTWTSDGVTNWLTSMPSLPTYRGDIVDDGTLIIRANHSGQPLLEFGGAFSGTGKVEISNFSQQGRFSGAFGFKGSVVGWQNGNFIWIDTPSVSGGFTKTGFNSCRGDFQYYVDYCGNGVMFGQDGCATPSDHEFVIDELTGRANDQTDEKGRRWRVGGEVIVWGSNVVHIGKLTDGLHVVARPEDQDCRNGWVMSGKGIARGIGFLVVDTLASGNLYLSTNIHATVGTVASEKSVFDYTYQAGGVNGMTLAFTSSCPAEVEVRATDLAMLPARLSGFAGKVVLTETEAKEHKMTVDLTHGANGVYNAAGCDGSGRLAEAPQEGTIDAALTFVPTEEQPKAPCGDYALARFSSGGEAFANWTVKIDGEEITSSATRYGRLVALNRDRTGLWLSVRPLGFQVIIR